MVQLSSANQGFWSYMRAHKSPCFSPLDYRCFAHPCSFFFFSAFLLTPNSSGFFIAELLVIGSTDIIIYSKLHNVKQAVMLCSC